MYFKDLKKRAKIHSLCDCNFLSEDEVWAWHWSFYCWLNLEGMEAEKKTLRFPITNVMTSIEQKAISVMQTGWNRRCRRGIIEKRGWHTQTQNHLTSIPQRCSVIICWKTQFICLGEKERRKRMRKKNPWREGGKNYSTSAAFFRSTDVFRQQGTL